MSITIGCTTVGGPWPPPIMRIHIIERVCTYKAVQLKSKLEPELPQHVHLRNRIVVVIIIIIIMVLQPGSSLDLPRDASPLHSVRCLGCPVVTSTSFKAFFSTLYNKSIFHVPTLLGRLFSFFSIITGILYENIVFRCILAPTAQIFVRIHIWYARPIPFR